MLSFIFMYKKKVLLCIVGFLLLFMLVVLPGIFSSYILSHELYHVFKHRDSAESLCFDVNNPPYMAHVMISFDNGSDLRTYSEVREEVDERMANRLGNLLSAVYIVFSILAIFLIAWIINDSKPVMREHVRRMRRHVRGHMKRLRKGLRGKSR